MAKLNVNAASREELVEVAGLRPELAEAIIRFRDERGKLTKADELDAVQGVGPATLDQLRKTLTFGETAKEEAERERTKAAQEATRTVKETAQKTAEVTASAVGGAAEAGRGAARAGAEAAATAARSGLQVVQRTVGAVSEVPRETARQSTEGTAELGKLFVDLFNEQTRHNLEVVTALSRAGSWEEMVRIQGDFLRASMERMGQLNSRYLEIIRSVMTAAASTAKDQDRRGA